ncbi:cation diffusion facilitator family transporter [Sporolactobacillus kofuensis]|uniref:Cation diffusion facilitator family transporter n=1 Tax=Sporolactobacillus kofuensis TaxID=269672 RepID=A0ABW1WDK9_9BACL|nr:cation diffusion facilitator family transporter [Sporolactobacillus kofuensis]MCO7176655.1 cation diffusion facilitator family transporter [Sporolactobacillus kofuensis]
MDTHNKNHESTQNHEHHHPSNNQKLLFISFLIISVFMIVEAIGGFLSHSLTLLSDAGHMLSDAVSLGLSFIAMVVSARASANTNKTFGYKRFEILAALFNGVLLLIISLVIIIEAISRLRVPQSVASSEMLFIASIGLVVNIVVAGLLIHGEKEENLNIRSAFLHVLGDLLGSVGAIVASLMIMWFGWVIADPIASILVSLIILKSGWGVTRQSVNILMEAKPENLDLEEVRSRILQLNGVQGLHDLHIWTITSGFYSLSCHLTVSDGVDRDQILTQVEQLLADYHLEHSTIQIENSHYAECRSDCAHQKHG